MNIILGTNIKIKELNHKTDLTIMNYLNKSGIIKGKKKIYLDNIVPLIEFKDHTRIWLMPEELDFL